MPNHVFVISEWLPKKGCEEKLLTILRDLMAVTVAKEEGCVRAHALQQVSHPNAPSTSPFPIVLTQEYKNVQAFEAHCEADYVADAFDSCIGNEATALVADWTCRLFEENVS